MSYILPDPRLEMPELLTPGRKPNGRVVIDWSRSITRNLLFCAIPVNRGADLVSDIVPELTNTARIPGYGFNTPDSGYDDAIRYQGVNFDIPASWSFTIIWNAYNTDANLGYQSAMYELTTGTNNHIISGSSDATRFYLRYKGSNIESNSAFSASVWNDDVMHDYMVVCRARSGPGGDIYTYLDGVQEHSAFSSSDASAETVTDVYIRSKASITNTSVVGYTEYLYIWGRSLTDKEYALIRRDPYQFLIPA